MHAVWLSPHAARQLLHYTDRCLDGPRAFVDQTLHCLCVAGRDPIICRREQGVGEECGEHKVCSHPNALGLAPCVL